MSATGGDAITIRADVGGGSEGFLVIDTSVNDSSAGGLRVAPELTLHEVATLAREMTLKFAFIGREAGGAKAGLRVPPGADAEEKRRALFELGRRLGPLVRRGLYHSGTDVGCGREDLAAFHAGAGLRTSDPTDTALFTAIGVRDVLAEVRIALGGGSRPLRLAIEGFGAVATHLARRLDPGAWSITAISTLEGTAVDERGFQPAELAAERQRDGDALVHRIGAVRGGRDLVFGAKVDVFVPSARTWSLTAARARALEARAVVPIANAPYGAGAVEVLESRDILCLPGFVSNCGGVFLSSLHDRGVPLADVERLSAHRFREIVRALLDARRRSGASPVRVSEEVALERLAQRRARVVPESTCHRVARVLVEELVPKRLLGRQRLERFSENLGALLRLVEEHGRVARPTVSRTGS